MNNLKGLKIMKKYFKNHIKPFAPMKQQNEAKHVFYNGQKREPNHQRRAEVDVEFSSHKIVH